MTSSIPTTSGCMRSGQCPGQRTTIRGSEINRQVLALLTMAGHVRSTLTRAMRLVTRASTFRGRGESMRRLASLIAAIAVVLLLASCSLISGFVGPSEEQVVRDKMTHIIEAINDRDAAALRAMFTEYARAKYSAEIDEGVAHLLSLFPHGDVIWKDDGEAAGSGSGLDKNFKRSWLGGL